MSGWNNPSAQRTDWLGAITHPEAKKAVAAKIAALARDGDVIGAGSGSTALLTLQALAVRVKAEGLRLKLIPTSRETELTAAALGLVTTSLLNDRPAWCYDGADEVDPQGNLIKGRGGAMYREKLVMRASTKRYILIDGSKKVERLGQKFTVPVEVLPEALHAVETLLRDIPGVVEMHVRPAQGKDGPVMTENGNLIVDVKFSAIDAQTEGRIKGITGVLESGLFWGFVPEIVSS